MATISPPRADADSAPPPASDQAARLRRDQLAMLFFGTWTITGLFVDGWAHQNNKPETFFTPWHLLLYSGFSTAVAWFSFIGWRDRKRGLEPLEDPGSRVAMVGLVLFIIGAVGDFVWHEVFGIEVDLAALLSPTHLLLMIGGVLLLSYPLRTAWTTPGPRAPGFIAFLPVLGSMTLVAGLVSFFTQYVSAFENQWWYGTEIKRYAATMRAEVREDFLVDAQIAGLASVLVTTTILFGSVMLLMRRWRPPVGTCTFLFTAVALYMTGMRSFDHAPLVLAAVVGGLVADLLLDRPRLLGLVAPVALWLTFFAVQELAWGVGWEVELWTGITVFASLIGGALSLLVDWAEPEAAALDAT